MLARWIKEGHLTSNRFSFVENLPHQLRPSWSRLFLACIHTSWSWNVTWWLVSSLLWFILLWVASGVFPPHIVLSGTMNNTMIACVTDGLISLWACGGLPYSLLFQLWHADASSSGSTAQEQMVLLWPAGQDCTWLPAYLSSSHPQFLTLRPNKEKGHSYQQPE